MNDPRDSLSGLSVPMIPDPTWSPTGLAFSASQKLGSAVPEEGRFFPGADAKASGQHSPLLILPEIPLIIEVLLEGSGVMCLSEREH